MSSAAPPRSVVSNFDILMRESRLCDHWATCLGKSSGEVGPGTGESSRLAHAAAAVSFAPQSHPVPSPRAPPAALLRPAPPGSPTYHPFQRSLRRSNLAPRLTSCLGSEAAGTGLTGLGLAQLVRLPQLSSMMMRSSVVRRMPRSEGFRIGSARVVLRGFVRRARGTALLETVDWLSYEEPPRMRLC